MRLDIVLVVCGFSFFSLLAVGTMLESYWANMPEQSTYCEMRQIWHDTQGEYGWPEYEAGKDEECE